MEAANEKPSMSATSGKRIQKRGDSMEITAVSGKWWKDSYSADEVEWVKCPLCGSSSYSQLAEERTLGIVCCSACHLVYVNPRVQIPRDRDGLEGALQKYGPIFAGLRPHNRDRNYLEHLRTIRTLKPAGRLLDVGTHCGFFLRMARNQGWELHGVEPSPVKALLAREKFGLDVYTSYLEDGLFSPESFDIVTMTDVLEHVAAPLELLSIVRKILKADGILFIYAPNVRWNLVKYRALATFPKLSSSDSFDPRERPVQYSQETLTKMLEKAGFQVKKFYVPRPVQTGEWWKRGARSVAYNLARGTFLCTGKLGPLATDLACVAEKR